MSTHFDSLETRPPDQREAELMVLLQRSLDRALSQAPGWKKHLGAVAAGDISDRKALAQLPVLRKSTLKELQAETPPFGGFQIGEAGEMGRVFMSPGPIFEPMGGEADPWRGARSLFAAGFRPGDLVHNAFAYYLTPGGFILDHGARALGCAVVPGGVGNTEQQIEAIAHLRPVAYTGTPDFLKVLQDKASEAGKDISSITKALVSGGALFPSLRAEYRERGVNVLQSYATAEAGLIAYESEALEGMIVDEGLILEIVRPGTGEPVADGEVGEVVVTTFNPVYPMFRLATGDLSAVLPGPSPCGRTNMRIKGWLGRADQTTKVKGMFVHPSQVAEISKRHPELKRLRLVVSRANEQDTMTLMAECGEAGGGLAEAVSQSVQAVLKLRGTVEIVAPGTLPNDGKVIADERSY